MEESIQKIFEQHQEGMNRQLLEHQRSMDEQFRSFTSLLHKLQSSNVSTKTAARSLPMHTEGRHPFSFNPRIELPLFMGGNPREWIKQCGKCFSLFKIPDNQKVTLASIHLEGRAKIWFEGYGQARPIVDWEDFIVDLYARFKDDKHVCSRFSNDAGHKYFLNHPASTSSPLITQEPFGSWSNIHLDGLETYQGHTSMVKSFSVNNVSLVESSADNPVQKDSSYLKLEFQVSRKTSLIPVDCSHLVEHLSSESCDDSDVAKRDKREIVKANVSEEHKSIAKLESVARTNSAESSQYSDSKVQFPPQGNPRSISFAIGGEIMANGMDYYCGNPFEWGHKCERKGIQPFLVDLLGKKVVDQFEIPGWAARAGSATSISIHTLPGNSGCQIMRMTGFVGKRALQFLIDSGGTHRYPETHLRAMGNELPKLIKEATHPQLPSWLLGLTAATRLQPLVVPARTQGLIPWEVGWVCTCVQLISSTHSFTTLKDVQNRVKQLVDSHGIDKILQQGPLHIQVRSGHVAYKLLLQEGAEVHNVSIESF
ncbi:unnamed protein product [Cuscuta campestris]|uniref:Retrotransposon gag domain-containing protein n=1 Tax=Cuscuta campestris TaxID=132261 RepID=A0A484L593_9ASTE|nr:unnamed protein product [Cuscuta campestris]